MWKSCRIEEKKIKYQFNEIKKAVEQRNEILKSYSDPLQDIRIIATPSVTLNDYNSYVQIESKKNFIPWQGHLDKLVDSFDARVHLDYIPKSSLSSSFPIPRDEIEIENDLNYQRYKCIVESKVNNISEVDCINNVVKNIDKIIVFNPIQHHSEKLKEQKIKENDFLFDYDNINKSNKSEHIDSNSNNNSNTQLLNSIGEEYKIIEYSKFNIKFIEPIKKELIPIPASNNHTVKNKPKKKKKSKKKQTSIISDPVIENKLEFQEEIDTSNLSPIELLKLKTRMKLSQVNTNNNKKLISTITPTTTDSNLKTDLAKMNNINSIENKTIPTITITTTTTRGRDVNSDKDKKRSRSRSRSRSSSRDKYPRVRSRSRSSSFDRYYNKIHKKNHISYDDDKYYNYYHNDDKRYKYAVY